MATDAAAGLLEPGRVRGPRAHYTPISGGDRLQLGDIGAVFPEALRLNSRLMSDELARDFRTWLVEPSFEIAWRRPLSLDSAQRRLATGEVATQSRYRRVKGPAGSGKSVVLGVRAAWLSARKKDVLVVTYNITLWHYIRDLAIRFPEPGRDLVHKTTWEHFHGWCRRVIVDQAGMKAKYDELWARHYRELGEAPGNHQGDLLGGRGDADMEAHLLDVELPTLARRAVNQARQLGILVTYDAILVDEGQDLSGEWWDVLQGVLRQQGEMWLFADDTQSLYGRTTAWTDAPMRDAGFRGRWSQLEGSYRLPRALVPILDRFIRGYLPGTTSDPPTVPQAQLALTSLEPLNLRWWQIDGAEDAAELCVEAVLSTPGFADPDMVAFTDITLLVSDRRLGQECVRIFQRHGIDAAHTFGSDGQQERKQKLGFFMNDSRVKVTTIHSFKGWETRALVVHIARAMDERALRAAYAGLSRLKSDPNGSYMTVVCAASQLEAFGRSMPEFQDHRGGRLRHSAVPSHDDVPF
jgi:hypothetical protein